MNKHDRLAQKLRGDAVRIAPPFSQELHQRTLQRLTASALPQGGTPLYPRRWRRYPLAIAASVLLALGALAFIWDPSELPVAQPPQVARARLSVPSAEQLMESALARPLKSAASGLTLEPLQALTADTRALGGYFLRQLPLESFRQSRPTAITPG